MSYFNRRMTDCFAKLRQKGKQIKTVLSGHKHWTLAVYYILVLFCVSILFVFFCPSFSSPKWRRKNNGMYKYIYAFTPRDTHAHHTHTHIWVVLRNCVPLGVGNFKLVFEGNLLLQCKYFYFLSLYVDVSDNKNSNDCQSCVLCTLNRTDVAKWIKNGATDLWHRQHHWKECIRNFIKTTQWQRI